MPRCEHRVAELLRYKGYEQFVPTRRARRGPKVIESALFPGYVFCRMTNGTAGLVVTTPGVLRILGSSQQPCPIDDAEIESIRKITSLDNVYPVPYLRVGQHIRIAEGPLSGVTGILVKIKKRHNLIVSVALLMRSISVEIDAAFSSAAAVVPDNRRLLTRSKD
jgi:transcription antitermination factor NusG